MSSNRHPFDRALIGVVLLAVSVCALVVLVGARGADARRPSRDLLPDLDQETPAELGVRSAVIDGRTVYALGFRSAVRNIGRGPLVVDASRADRSTPTMEADQIVARRGMRPRRIDAIGRFRYVVAPTHRHWHYLHFDRYELRRADSDGTLVTDRKSGFCLGDRYSVPGATPAAPASPVYTGRCGLDRPDLLQMREGISVGYGDDYPGFVEGQELPLSGLPDGRYVLVHHVNADRELAETSYANNAASVLLDLRWRDGAPVLEIMASCPDSARCGASDRTAAGESPVRLAAAKSGAATSVRFCALSAPA
jgi:hypothetical protein